MAEEEPAIIDDYPGWVPAMDEDGRSQERPWRPGVDPHAEGVLDSPPAAPLHDVARLAAYALARAGGHRGGEAVPPRLPGTRLCPRPRMGPRATVGDRGRSIRLPLPQPQLQGSRLCRASP